MEHKEELTHWASCCVRTMVALRASAVEWEGLPSGVLPFICLDY